MNLFVKYINSRSNFTSNIFFVIVSILSLYFIFINIFSSIIGASITSGDQNWFLPIVWAFSETGVLFHPLSSPIPENPERLLIWHGWLMPWLQGHLTLLQGYQHVRLSGDIIAFITLSSYIYYFHKHMSKLYAIMCIPIMAALVSYQTGRPELIISAILISHLIAERYIKPLPLMAVTLSLLAITSPAGGFLIGLTLLFRIYPIINDLRKFIIFSLKIAFIVPLLIYILTSAVAGLDPLSWLGGIMAHGSIMSERTDGQVIQYAVMQPFIPLNFLMIFVIIIIFYHKISNNFIFPYIFMISIISILIFYLSFLKPSAIYNYLALIPIIIIMFNEISDEANSLLVKIGKSMIIIFSLACSIALIRIALLETITIGTGNKFAVWANEFKNISTDSYVYFSSSEYPFILSSGLEPVEILRKTEDNKILIKQDNWERDHLNKNYENKSFRLEMQANSGRNNPKISQGECLVFSNFQTAPPAFLGLAIGRTRKDWSFAITRKCITLTSSQFG